MESANYNKLYLKVRDIILDARNNVVRTINYAQLISNWEIGRLIVQEEQNGKPKAQYGKYIIKELSKRLTAEFGQSYDESNLRRYRQFYKIFPIRATARHKLPEPEKQPDTIRATVRHQSEEILPKTKTPPHHPLFDIISPQLSWSHYKLIITIENEHARNFYIKEAVANNWSTRALARQINSLYYERLLSSKDKDAVYREMRERTGAVQAEDILKDPLVLEFLQLKDQQNYLESELEEALLKKLNDFLLELGKGFAFVARQKRISTETKQFYIDLVFYNYILKCFVLIDLKTGELTHQDIGQMDMYVRIFEDKHKLPDDNPTIGLILCTQKDRTIAKYSVLNESKQLFASKYQLYLPTEQELINEVEREIHFLEQKKIK